MWNPTERKGKIDQVKGQVKQAVGVLADDQPLTDEGKAEEAVGQARRKVGEVLTHIADVVNK